MRNLARLLIAAAIIAVSAFTLAACQPKANEINLLTWEGYVPKEVVDNFEAETGIKVNYSTFNNNEEMYSKLQAQKKTYDIVICSDYIIDIMIKESGFLQKFDKSKIANLKNIDPSYQSNYFDPNNEYSIPYAAASAIIVYDSAKVDFEVKGYKDLWNPAFKDKVVVLDGDRDVIGFALKTLGYSVNETDPANLELAKAEVLKLKPNIISFDANMPHNAMINGDAVIGYMFGSQATEVINVIPSAKIVYPEEGLTYYIDSVVLCDGAPNIDNANKFLNYITSGEVSARISMLINYPNTNSDAKKYLSDEYLNNTAVNIPEALASMAEMYQDVGEAKLIYDKIWTDLKAQ